MRGQIPGLRGQISGLIGQISGLRGPGGTDGWTDGRNDEQKSPCVLQDFVSFGATALLPLTIGAEQKTTKFKICVVFG